MSKKVLLALAVCTAVAGLSAGSAFAGEVTGNGKKTPIGQASEEGGPPHASSICSFSGQNDGEPPPGRKAEHVQNWGQIPKEVRDVIAEEGEHPGDACNGHTGFFSGG
ncbi:MAG TPA: hypothetical protein VFU84_10680 [Gaiellaceae bacterium]|nr:hypothetical protein [Gaiellaceae bacterium]